MAIGTYKFPWEADSGSYSPADVKRKREIADALRGKDNMAKDAGPLGAIQNTIAGALGGYTEQQALQGEQAGRASADEVFAALNGESPQSDILKAMGNEWANPGQSAVAQALLGQQFQQNDPRYQLGLKHDQLNYDQDLAGQGDDQETWYGNTVYYKDPETGKIIAGQQSNRGNFRPSTGTEGYEPAIPVQQLNTGTEFVPRDKFGGTVPGAEPLPINNEEKAFAEGMGSESGKAAAGRIIALPNLLAKADNMIDTIDGVLNDPALDYSTGWLSFLQMAPGTDQYRFGQRALQLQGQAFLQAFESLKGGGQITEVEGNKATQAIGRLSTAQKAEDYRDALNELKGIINEARSRAQTQAGVTPTAPAAPEGQTPAPGAVQPGADGIYDAGGYF